MYLYTFIVGFIVIFVSMQIQKWMDSRRWLTGKELETIGRAYRLAERDLSQATDHEEIQRLTLLQNEVKNVLERQEVDLKRIPPLIPTHQ